jgi:hypothetical protein
MKALLAVLTTLALGADAVAQDVALASSVDRITQDSVQAAFRVLRRDYIRREDLTLDQLNRAALQGLLARLDFGAEIVRAADSTDASLAPLVSHEELTSRIGYLRLTVGNGSEVPKAAAALKGFTEHGITQVVLDLRTPAPPAELESAAALAELFLPKGEVLFKLRRLGGGDARLMISRSEQVWKGKLVVLVDAETNNSSETLAAVLRQKGRALIVGSQTRGATVRYDEAPLEPGWKLRFASAEVLLADDSSVFRRGVTPHFQVEQTPQEKAAIYRTATTEPMASMVFEKARERFNERSLVAGKNPEFDEYVSRSAGKIMSYDQPGPRDVVLQRAVDLIQNAEMASEGNQR